MKEAVYTEKVRRISCAEALRYSSDEYIERN
jgi:hypothetical protein